MMCTSLENMTREINAKKALPSETTQNIVFCQTYAFGAHLGARWFIVGFSSVVSCL